MKPEIFQEIYFSICKLKTILEDIITIIRGSFHTYEHFSHPRIDGKILHCENSRVKDRQLLTQRDLRLYPFLRE